MTGRISQNKRIRAAFVCALVCSYTIGNTEQLTPEETRSFLQRVTAVPYRTCPAHIVEDSLDAYDKDLGETEYWYSPGELHVRSESEASDTYYDRFGTYQLSQNGKQLTVFKPSGLRLESPLDWIFGLGVRQLTNVKVNTISSGYLVEGKLGATTHVGTKLEQDQVSELLTSDLLPVHLIERTRRRVYLPSSPGSQSVSTAVTRAQSPQTEVQTIEYGVTGYSLSDGIRYPSGWISSFAGHKTGTRKVITASFIHPAQPDLTPNLLSPDLVIEDHRTPTPMFWTHTELLRANGGGVPIDTQRYLALTALYDRRTGRRESPKARSQALRTELLTRNRSEKTSSHLSLQTVLKFGGVVLIIAFLFSAYKTLTAKRRWGA